jgi:hypothetical protein
MTLRLTQCNYNGWTAKERRVDLHYPCASAYDDEDKSDEEEDAPAREAAVGIACHVVLCSQIMQSTVGLRVTAV